MGRAFLTESVNVLFSRFTILMDYDMHATYQAHIYNHDVSIKKIESLVWN